MDTRPAIIDEVTTLLDGVDAALVRLSDGTYRSCESCDAPISDEALDESPTRRHCDAHRVG